MNYKKTNVGVFSMGPLFKHIIHGGSQRTLLAILDNLSEYANVQVICARRDDNFEPFYINNIKVFPILPMKQPFPHPYSVSIEKLAEMIHIMKEFLYNKDILYIHDSQFLFKSIFPSRLKVVCGIRDLVYMESLMGLLIYAGSKVIVPSHYVKNEIIKNKLDEIGIAPSLISVKPHGVDLKTFFPKKDKKNNSIKRILFPHRAEFEKGLSDLLYIAESLKDYPIVISIVEHIDPSSSINKVSPIAEYKSKLLDKGLDSIVEFIPWLTSKELRDKYNSSDLTISLSYYPETFGNVIFESLACGTPVISYNSGAIPELTQKFKNVFIVNRGDIDSIVRKVKSILFDEDTLYIEDDLELLSKEWNSEKLIPEIVKEILD